MYCRHSSARRCGRWAIPDEAEHSVHFSYEMVALSHATARELGYAGRPGQDAGCAKPFVEVSGRKGLGVKIDDLLDTADREGRGGGGQAEPGVPCRRPGAVRRDRLPSPPFATSC